VTQYPNSFLQSESQPWGRSVEQRLADLERGDQLVAQESGNNFAQINSSITLLSQQITAVQNSIVGLELLGKATAAQKPTFTLAQSGLNTITDLTKSPSLFIDLPQPARILLSANMEIDYQTNSVGTPLVLSVLTWQTSVSGSATLDARFSDSGSGTTAISGILSLSASALYSAPAGLFSAVPQLCSLTMRAGATPFFDVGPIVLSAIVLPA
jgi:hypothetical protein